MIAQLVDIVGDAPPRLVLAELVRQVDFDRAAAIAATVGRRSALFKPPRESIMPTMRCSLIACCSPLLRPRSGDAPAPPRLARPGSPHGIRSRRLHHRRPGRAGLSHLVSRRACARRLRSRRSTTISIDAMASAGSFPTWQLLRTATSWQRCGAPAVRGPADRANGRTSSRRCATSATMSIPAVGPVEPVSVYRNPALNVCAGGAPESAHKHYSAIDMVPLRPITREALMRDAVRDPREAAAQPISVGLGFYAFLRFHVDTHQVPALEHGPGGRGACPPIVHPDDVAIGRPAAAAAAQRRRRQPLHRLRLPAAGCQPSTLARHRQQLASSAHKRLVLLDVQHHIGPRHRGVVEWISKNSPTARAASCRRRRRSRSASITSGSRRRTC